jgi:DNA-directed RNA polymerase specialized sigma24 family protein
MQNPPTEGWTGLWPGPFPRPPLLVPIGPLPAAGPPRDVRQSVLRDLLLSLRRHLAPAEGGGMKDDDRPAPPRWDPWDPEAARPPGAGQRGRALAVSKQDRAERRLVERFVLAAHVASSDVEDVIQEVMIAAARAEHRFSVPEGSHADEARSAWLRGIAARCVAHHFRKLARRGPIDLRPDMPSGDWHGRGVVPSAEELALARTDHVLLHDGLALLRETAPHAHAVVVAHELDELPMDRVAATFGLRVNTAWNRLRIGRTALREHLHQTVTEPVARRPAVPPALPPGKAGEHRRRAGQNRHKHKERGR